MIAISTIELISLLSVWMLEPRLPETLVELRKRGYVTAKVKPRDVGGYDITFIESNVVAIKGSTYIQYNPGRRSISIGSSNVKELLFVFNEVESILKEKGSDPNKGALFYELKVKAKAVGNRLVLRNRIETDDLLGVKLLAIPISFVAEDADPNRAQWFHLDIRPIWTSWPNEKIHYEIILVYRDDKDKLIKFLENIEEKLNEFLKRVFNKLIG